MMSDKDHFSLRDEPLSESDTGWETVSSTVTGIEGSQSSSPLSSPEFRFSSSERELSPAVNNQRNYMAEERLSLALASYFAKLEKYEERGDKKPLAAPIAREYDVNERTLQKQIKNPTKQTRSQQHATIQRLTEEEEASVVAGLRFLDSWNVPADRDQVIELGEVLLHKRNPDEHLGETWFHNFRRRHQQEVHFVYCGTKNKNRANAEDWNIISDFYIKVRKIKKY